MYKKLFSETIIYGIGAVLPRLLNFLIISFFTDKIPNAGDFSSYGNLYAAVSIINVVLSFGFETSYFRFSATEKESKVFNTGFWFLCFNALVFVMTIYLFTNPLAHFSGYEVHKEYLYWFAWIIFFDTLAILPFAWLRYHNKPLAFSSIKLMSTFVNIGLTVLLLTFFINKEVNIIGIKIQENIAFAFVANLFASILTFLLLLKIILKVQFQFDLQLFKKMFRYSYPIMLAGLAFAINENFDKLVQKELLGDIPAGAYAACYKLAALMTIFVTAFRMGIEPFLFKEMNNLNVKTIYATILEYFTIVGGLIILGILGNISWLETLFIRSASYRIALGIIPIIIIANLFFGIYNNLSIWYKVNDKTYIGTIISGIGALITIVLNLVFIPKVGFIISAWATVIVYFAMMLISYFWGQKEYKIPYKWKKILFYMLLSILLSLSNYYYLDKNVISGNLFIFIYIGVVYYFEKEYLLKALIKK